MKTLSLISDKKAESINGGFLNTTVTQSGANANSSVGQGLLIGVGTVFGGRFV